jgi:hypothetical protein
MQAIVKGPRRNVGHDTPSLVLPGKTRPIAKPAGNPPGSGVGLGGLVDFQ